MIEYRKGNLLDVIEGIVIHTSNHRALCRFGIDAQLLTIEDFIKEYK